MQAHSVKFDAGQRSSFSLSSFLRWATPSAFAQTRCLLTMAACLILGRAFIGSVLTRRSGRLDFFVTLYLLLWKDHLMEAVRL